MSVFTAMLSGENGTAISTRLTELSLTQSLESPAESLLARFVCEKAPPDVYAAHISLDGIPVFTGRLDRQKTSLTQKGTILQVECRSSGALLLDNEALPQVYINADINTLFSRCIAPYGFSLENPNGGKWLSLYTVRKGISEWEAFSGFVGRAYSITPYARGNRVIIGKPDPGSGFLLSNTSPGVRFTRLEYAFKPYEIISEVVIRDSAGYYSASVENPYAKPGGIARKRYSSPTSDLAETASADAYSRISASMAASLEISATIPEILDCYPGSVAAVSANGLERHNLIIGSMTYRMDETGCYTDLVLVPGA